ncbi:MAG: hypothetical protein KGR26_12835, partial [Cyanobacteria bacterium REEB65]|nr:hypothetical protein [Cyanobacteria bacterium REEB65]
MHKLTVLAAAAMLAGCANPANLAGAKLPGSVTLAVSAQALAGRYTQSLVTPWTPQNVDHLEFMLSQASGSAWTPLATASTPAGSGTTETANFLHLKMDTTYKVQVSAFTADGQNITANDGSGVATITTSNDNFVPLSLTVDLA